MDRYLVEAHFKLAHVAEIIAHVFFQLLSMVIPEKAFSNNLIAEQ